MKKILIIATFLMGLFVVPAFAASSNDTITVKDDVLSSSYSGKKDDAYWTRVWYAKQAKKNRKYKNRRLNKKVGAKKRRYRAKKRSSNSRVVARVNLSTQRMNVYQNGVRKYTWKISSGRKGYRTPTGTWRIHRMHKEYYSKKYNNSPMPYAMFYHRGFAVHGTGSLSKLGRTASHGCVRLHPSNAAKLFSMVRRSGGTVKVTY